MTNAQHADPRAARKEKQNDLTTEPLPSITAGVSWMFGLLSIPLLFVPPTAVITGFLAIVFGHVAKFRIRSRPEYGGESVATNGLLMGYLCFLAALALLPSIRMQSAVTQGIWDSFRGVVQAKSGTEFKQVERSFLDSGGASTGNSKETRELAAQLAITLNEMRSEAFNSRGTHKIRTLCQQNNNGICVVALIPDLADFEQSARDGMLNLVWSRSQELAFGLLRPGDDITVAVRDRIRYQSMEFGRATRSPDRIPQPDASFIDVTMLDPFFETDDKQESSNETNLGENDEERE